MLLESRIVLPRKDIEALFALYPWYMKQKSSEERGGWVWDASFLRRVETSFDKVTKRVSDILGRGMLKLIWDSATSQWKPWQHITFLLPYFGLRAPKGVRNADASAYVGFASALDSKDARDADDVRAILKANLPQTRTVLSTRLDIWKVVEALEFVKDDGRWKLNPKYARSKFYPYLWKLTQEQFAFARSRLEFPYGGSSRMVDDIKYHHPLASTKSKLTIVNALLAAKVDDLNKEYNKPPYDRFYAIKGALETIMGVGYRGVALSGITPGYLKRLLAVKDTAEEIARRYLESISVWDAVNCLLEGMSLSRTVVLLVG